jgi:D-alanyl-lipoteichoic acid acyltransferase DltB (MBOAT superfamily)
MITMLLGGLWHGASWNFVIWGGLHGLYLAVHKAMSSRRRDDSSSEEPFLADMLKRSAIFILATFTWLFFRSSDWGTTVLFLKGMLALDVLVSEFWVPFVLLALLTLLIDLPQELRRDELFVRVEPLTLRAAVAAFWVLLIVFSGTEATPFIYFQF